MTTTSRISSRGGAIVAALLVGVVGCSRPVADPADSIYVNANIITMNDAQPRAEALAVKGGKVLVVGTRKDVEAHKGSATKVIDLAGKTVTPGFIDGHGHLSGVGLTAAGANLLPPPDGTASSIATLQQAMRDWMKSYSQEIRNRVWRGLRRFANSGAAPPDPRRA